MQKTITKKQQAEKDNLEWFCPSLFKQYPPQEGDFQKYLAHSERGIPITSFNVYSEAKRWRGIIVHELWEDSFYCDNGKDWWPGYHELLTEEDGTPIPEHIKDYIKKEIFGGQSKDLIDKVYEEIKLAM